MPPDVQEEFQGVAIGRTPLVREPRMGFRCGSANERPGPIGAQAEISANADQQPRLSVLQLLRGMAIGLAPTLQKKVDHAAEAGRKMTLRIERDSGPHGTTTIRLVGRIREEHVAELKAQIRDGGPSVALDLSEVDLVDLNAVRFLGDCQREGVVLLHCSPYVSDWIAREQEGEK